jgi:hypothetical protein
VAEAREVIEALLRDLRGKNEPVEMQVQQLMAAVLVHEKRQGEAVELLDSAVLTRAVLTAFGARRCTCAREPATG